MSFKISQVPGQNLNEVNKYYNIKQHIINSLQHYIKNWEFE